MNNLKLPFEYPFKEALAIYWKRTKQTLSVLIYFLIFFAIFVVSRYVYLSNKDFFLHNLDFLIPFVFSLFSITILIGIILLTILASSELEIKIITGRKPNSTIKNWLNKNTE